jgi:hypothetical protein
MAPSTHLPRFTELPVDVQRYVFDLAAIDASTDQRILATRSILTTHLQVSITRMPQLPEDSTSNAAAGEYYLEIERPNWRNLAYIPLLRLCRDARAAMAEQEVFVVTMHPYVTGWVHHVREWVRYLWSQSTSPPLPLFGGVTRELLLVRPSDPNLVRDAHAHMISMDQLLHLTRSSYPDLGYDAQQVLISMAQVFGTQVRRIHLCGVALADVSSGWHYFRSEQTARIYGLPYWWHLDPEWHWRLEEAINDQFPKLPTPAEYGHPQVNQHRVGEFADEDARVFMLGPCTGTRRIDQYAEVIRQYPDGRTLMNSGVKEHLAQYGYPTAISRDLLQQVAGLATRYFPLLEYISVLGEMN